MSKKIKIYIEFELDENGVGSVLIQSDLENKISDVALGLETANNEFIKTVKKRLPKDEILVLKWLDSSKMKLLQ